MTNQDVTLLDPGQAFKRVVDGSVDAIRVIYPHNQEMSIAVSAEDGDSVMSLPLVDVITTPGEHPAMYVKRAVLRVQSGTVTAQQGAGILTQIQPNVITEILATRLVITASEGAVFELVVQS